LGVSAVGSEFFRPMARDTCARDSAGSSPLLRRAIAARLNMSPALTMHHWQIASIWASSTQVR